MDTSKEYQEMCRNLPFDTNWKEGDVYAAGEHTCADFKWAKIVIGVCDEECDEGGKPTRNYKCQSCGRSHYAEVWKLWRQDELQEMYQNYLISLNQLGRLNPYGLSMKIHEFSKLHILCFNSMEQLWLAFVMHEKYQMRWNKTEWVKV